jgi:hypothetical protein
LPWGTQESGGGFVAKYFVAETFFSLSRPTMGKKYGTMIECCVYGFEIANLPASIQIFGNVEFVMDALPTEREGKLASSKTLGNIFVTCAYVTTTVIAASDELFPLCLWHALASRGAAGVSTHIKIALSPFNNLTPSARCAKS